MASKKQQKKAKTATLRRKTASTSRVEPTPPPREPWTPWGKWAKRRQQRIEKKRQERDNRRSERQHRRQQRRRRRRTLVARALAFLFLGAVACGIGIGIILLLGRPYPWELAPDVNQVLSLTGNLETNAERWQSLSINNYRVSVEYISDDGTWCGPAEINVIDNRITQLPSPDETHWFPAENCNQIIESLTIDNAFDWTAEQLQDFKPGVTYLEVDFNSEFGFILRVEAGVYDPDNNTDGCCWTISWSNLVPGDE